MQTNFSAAQLQDPELAEADKVLRACVHCGFCTATCPTYVLLGDELDSPRGRIYLIKDMLEQGKPASPTVVKHVDRCLSCLACMTTCPSSVNYMHLVDQARVHIERTYRRPLMERMQRRLLGWVLPRQKTFRVALALARLARPLRGLLPARLRAMLDLAPTNAAGRGRALGAGLFPARGERRKRVALLGGCVQPTLRPQITEATIRLLNRRGLEVVIPKDVACCGSLNHHLGEKHAALALARRNVDAWIRELDGEGLDAVVVTASGCGTMLKDYGHLLRDDPDYAQKAARVSALARDISELLSEVGLGDAAAPADLRVAYQSPCSLQHGQQVKDPPRSLLRAAGFTVLEVPEGHLCCGSAGVYNILQPDIARDLRARKVANIEKTRPDVVATGNFGCLNQIAGATTLPVVHLVELLDWAAGGPNPLSEGRPAPFTVRTLKPPPARR